MCSIRGSGAAYVFFRADGDWAPRAKLVPSDGAAYDEFGWSVAIDGLTVVVGAWLANGPLGSNQGAAYVFARSSDGEWSEQVKLEALDGGSEENFGYAVAVDGDTVLVGARRHSATAYLAGAAYVFVRSGPGWTQQQKLESNDIQSADLFGTSVAIEGETAVIGASHDDHAGGGNEGSAYVFTRSGTVWSQQQRLFASDAAPDDFFASSVAISGDTVVASTWEDDHAGGDDAGSAYVFLRSGNTWSQQQKLVAADAAPEDAFGYSVSVDGDTAVVGAIWKTTPHRTAAPPTSSCVRGTPGPNNRNWSRMWVPGISSVAQWRCRATPSSREPGKTLSTAASRPDQLQCTNVLRTRGHGNRYSGPKQHLTESGRRLQYLPRPLSWARPQLRDHPEFRQPLTRSTDPTPIGSKARASFRTWSYMTTVLVKPCRSMAILW